MSHIVAHSHCFGTQLSSLTFFIGTKEHRWYSISTSGGLPGESEIFKTKADDFHKKQQALEEQANTDARLEALREYGQENADIMLESLQEE